jgi:hypothetical protein
MSKLEFITARIELGYPVDDESVRNDPVVVDALIADDGTYKTLLKTSMQRIFTDKCRTQIPMKGTIVFDVKRDRSLMQAVMQSPLLPALRHDIAVRIFCVLPSEPPQL